MNTQLQALRETLESAVQKADAEGIEFWFARDLQEPLGYARWENFKTAVHRAIDSCEAAEHQASDHFRGVTKMVELIVGRTDASQPNMGLTHWQDAPQRKIPMSMADWVTLLEGFLEFNGNEILTGPGKISHEQAKLHAETEFEKYRVVQDQLYASDFDRFLEEQVASYAVPTEANMGADKELTDLIKESAGAESFSKN